MTMRQLVKRPLWRKRKGHRLMRTLYAHGADVRAHLGIEASYRNICKHTMASHPKPANAAATLPICNRTVEHTRSTSNPIVSHQKPANTATIRPICTLHTFKRRTATIFAHLRRGLGGYWTIGSNVNFAVVNGPSRVPKTMYW